MEDLPRSCLGRLA